MKVPPKKPHFFKPIWSGFKHGLKIPLGFLKYLKGHKDHIEHVVLRRTGKKWLVKVNGGRFEDGWAEFVEQYDLELGDILVFRHEGDMEFEVSIFDSTTHCEREYVHEEETDKKFDLVVDQEEEDQIDIPASERRKAQRPSEKNKGKGKISSSSKTISQSGAPKKASVPLKRRKQPQVNPHDVVQDSMEESSYSSQSRAPRTKGPGAPSKVRPQSESSTGLTKEERQVIMRSQKVLRGRVFDPEVVDMNGMAELVEMVTFQGWRHLFVPPVPALHEHEVREFYHELTFVDNGTKLFSKVNGVTFMINEQILSSILQVPARGIRSVEGECARRDFISLIAKLGNITGERVLKKQMKGEYQLLFEFINKVLLPRAEKRTVAGIADLFLMEALSTFQHINLASVMIEHMHKIMHVKDGKHGLAYGFLLNKVFDFFNIECGLGIVGSKKQMFTLSTLEECECVLRRGGVKSQSLVSELIASQEKSNVEIERLTGLLAQKEAEIVRLKAHQVEEPGTVSALKEENEALKAEVKELTKKLLHAYETFNGRISAFLPKLSGP